MKKISLYLLLVAPFLISGCAPIVVKEEVIVYKTKTVLLEPPEALYRPVELVPPPDKEEYLAYSPQQKENAWVDIYIKQNKNIAICNRQDTDLKNWVAEQKSIYDKDEAPK